MRLTEGQEILQEKRSSRYPLENRVTGCRYPFLLGFLFPSEVSFKRLNEDKKDNFVFFLLQVTKIDIQPQFDLAEVVGDALDRQVSVIKYIEKKFQKLCKRFTHYHRIILSSNSFLCRKE